MNADEDLHASDDRTGQELREAEMLILDPAQAAEDERLRSEYVRRLVQSTRNESSPSVSTVTEIPRVIVQFWHDASRVPSDVRECLASWAPLSRRGFDYELFDDESARRFISSHLGQTFVAAFDRCPHPAMRCDYFRLCYVLICGGFYVDADDHYLGRGFEGLFVDNRLKVQPLCYDIETDTMVSPTTFARREVPSPQRIFYVNNNPLIAPPGHPVVNMALRRSTRALLYGSDSGDIQSTTGPGNLTASLVRHAATRELAGEEHDFVLLADWGSIARSRWPLSYRNDERNWRLWDPNKSSPW